jgi:hypothetical protein
MNSANWVNIVQNYPDLAKEVVLLMSDYAEIEIED